MELKHQRGIAYPIGLSSFNRTLWNWNHSCGNNLTISPFLLIVPCGIETHFGFFATYYRNRLLIVPCGIETESDCGKRYDHAAFNRTLWNWNLSRMMACILTMSFNRTLWNWNSTSARTNFRPAMSFNRTLWNWNLYADTGRTERIVAFNRTLWNWNSSTIRTWFSASCF